MHVWVLRFPFPGVSHSDIWDVQRPQKGIIDVFGRKAGHDTHLACLDRSEFDKNGLESISLLHTVTHSHSQHYYIFHVTDDNELTVVEYHHCQYLV